MKTRHWRAPIASMVIAWVLVGCSSLNPFASSIPAMAPVQPTMKSSVAWKVSVGGDSERYVFSPVVVQDQVITAAANGVVMRLDGKGANVWRVTPVKRLSAGVGSDGRLAVVVSESGEVIALNASDGSVRWRTPLGVEVLAPPAVNGDVVVVRSSDNRLIGLEASDGKRRWIYQRNNPPLAMRSTAGMLIDTGTVVAGYPGGKLLGIATRNGALSWELSVAQPKGATELERMNDIAGTPLASNGELCAVAYQGRISCFDFAKGSAVWSVEFSSVVGLDRDNRNVFAVTDKGILTALDSKTGIEDWKTNVVSGRKLTRPVVFKDYVVVGDVAGNVHFFDRREGLWLSRVFTDGSPIVGEPIAFSEGVLVQTRRGSLYLVKPE